MRDWYWRVVAAAGVMVAAVYVFGVCRPFAPAPVSAQGANIIAATPGNQNAYTLYVIDASKRVLLVYDSSGRGSLNSFSLVYGRRIDTDAVVVSQALHGELKFNPRGYKGSEVSKALRGR